ncbi:Uncharacterised protein [Chlamydia trachomatis]|nr:Uncharacterised protein [Chlamydia trachomatis]
MIVTITSDVPRKARRIPGIAPATPPAIMAINTVIGTKMRRGKSGFSKANHAEKTQPTKACPGKPTLKKPARLATANPSAVKTSGAMARKISPIDFTVPKAE